MHDGVNRLVHKNRTDCIAHANEPYCKVKKSLFQAVHAVMALVLLLVLPGTLRAEEGRSYLDVSGGYKTGTFDTPYRSNLGYISTGFGYVTPVYDFGITIPYLFLSSESQSGTQNTSGIGDIILRGGMVLVRETTNGFSLDGSLSVKIPTADETKGLGTGETDFGAFLNAHQKISDVKLSLFGGYIKVGSPSNINYNDIYTYGVEISKIFGYTELWGSFEGRRATVSGAQDPQEIHVGMFHVLNKDYAIHGSTFVGLNDGGPNFGLDFGVTRWF